MFNHGDINASLSKLKIELKQIKYPDLDEFNYKSAAEGDPRAFLPILHYSILNYSNIVGKYFLDNGYELFSKSDKDFIEILFRAMINLFNFKVKLNSQQFFKLGFAEGKILYCVEIIRLVRVYHNELNKKNNFLQKSNKSGSNKQNQIKSLSNDFSQKNGVILEYGNNLPKYTVINHQANQNNFFSENEIECERNVPKKLVEKNISLQKDKKNEIYPKQDQKIVINENNNSSSEYEKQNNEQVEEQGNYLEDYDNENENNYEDFVKNPHGNRDNEYQNEQLNNYNMTDNSNPGNNSIDMKVLTEIISNLSNSVKEMVRRVDDFKVNIETRVSKIEAEFSLVKNRITILEEEKNLTLQTLKEEQYPTTFSFADDNINKKEEFKMEKKKALNNINNQNEYSKSFNKSVNSTIKNNSAESSKVNEETDLFIDRIASRFKETQRLLNEIK